MSTIFDDRRCTLGEGPIWHPERGQLFWFDILGKKLLSRVGSETFEWTFDEYVSAAGWLDRDRFLIASQTQLFTFDLTNGTIQHVCPLEADNAITRSNDGRADPQGGFWIGTMGINAEPGAGSIYRFYKGELRRLFADITVSNSICFTPDGKTACFCDTATRQIMKIALGPGGWPVGAPELFVDLRAEGLKPDGSVIDSDGNLWNAQWGRHRVARYTPDGRFADAVDLAAEQTSCPAFGGDDLNTLYVTSAADGLTGAADGLVYAVATASRGQAEHRVVL